MQALLKAAFESGELTLPSDMDKQCFWKQYRALYKKEWSVRIEKRYEHGKGVMLYLARYCKGGPLHPDQIKGWDRGSVEMSYLDHRDKRVKRQRLSAFQLAQRLLQHVPATGVHTVRYYGLYAPAAKRRHARLVSLHGNLEGHKATRGVDLQSVVLCCKACGAPGKLLWQAWRAMPKGNSLIKSRPALGAGGTVQQRVEADNERGEFVDSS